MAKALAQMSEAELVAENQKLMRQKDKIQAQQLKLKERLDKLAAERQAGELVAGMSDTQIQAVAAAAKAVKR